MSDSMTAIEYVRKCKEICAYYEPADCHEGCPLRNYGCGIPLELEESELVVELVKAWQPANKQFEHKKSCPHCGMVIEGGSEE